MSKPAAHYWNWWTKIWCVARVQSRRCNDGILNNYFIVIIIKPPSTWINNFFLSNFHENLGGRREDGIFRGYFSGNIRGGWPRRFVILYLVVSSTLNRTTEEILFEVYDSNPNGGNQFMGLAIVSVEELLVNPYQRQVLSLQSRPYQDDSVSGTLTLEVSVNLTSWQRNRLFCFIEKHIII